MDFRRIRTNGIELHVACAGPEAGPLIVLLHGFPEFWYAWRAHIEPLAARGFRVVAPDMRGYNLSDKPHGISAYRIDHLVRDVVGLIDAAGRTTAVIVGHDWGGGVAWATAMQAPARVERLVVLNCGHPAATMKRILRDPRQLLRSWYMFAFQLPWLPERFARRDHFRLLVRGLEGSSRPGTFSPVDLDCYRAAWAQPHALTSMINYYRAAMQRRPPGIATQVTMPTRIIWGTGDRFLRRELADDSLGYCDRGTVDYLDTSHWVQHEAPARTLELIATP
jgi:pimeloyl-ACP methyl ester carboxylesterase